MGPRTVAQPWPRILRYVLLTFKTLRHGLKVLGRREQPLMSQPCIETAEKKEMYCLPDVNSLSHSNTHFGFSNGGPPKYICWPSS